MGSLCCCPLRGQVSKHSAGVSKPFTLQRCSRKDGRDWRGRGLLKVKFWEPQLWQRLLYKSSVYHVFKVPSATPRGRKLKGQSGGQDEPRGRARRQESGRLSLPPLPALSLPVGKWSYCAHRRMSRHESLCRNTNDHTVILVIVVYSHRRFSSGTYYVSGPVLHVSKMAMNLTDDISAFIVL